MPYTGGYPRATEIQVVRGQYDFSVDGGAQGSIDLGHVDVPDNAIVLGGYLEVLTILASGGSATGQIDLEGTGDIVASAAFNAAPWSSTDLKSIIPVFTGATMVKTTQARTPQLTIGTADLTGGKFDLVLFYTQVPD